MAVLLKQIDGEEVTEFTKSIPVTENCRILDAFRHHIEDILDMVVARAVIFSKKGIARLQATFYIWLSTPARPLSVSQKSPNVAGFSFFGFA